MPTTAKTTARRKGVQNHRRSFTARVNGRQKGSDNRDLSEARIVALAISEKLAKAGRQDIKTQLKLGIPVTYQVGDEVIKHYPDGRKEVLETIPRRKFKVPKGVAIISNK